MHYRGRRPVRTRHNGYCHQLASNRSGDEFCTPGHCEQIDPEPRMREMRDMRKGEKSQSKSSTQIENTVYEPDED